MAPYGVKPGTPPFDHRPVAMTCTRTSAANSCATDHDCDFAVQACACAQTDGAPTAGVCVPAFCHVDRDCGTGGYCSPSYVNDYGSCTGSGPAYPRLTGIYCHTAQDKCNNDSDCGSSFGAQTCAWSPAIADDPATWTCNSGYC